MLGLVEIVRQQIVVKIVVQSHAAAVVVLGWTIQRQMVLEVSRESLVLDDLGKIVYNDLRNILGTAAAIKSLALSHLCAAQSHALES